MIGDTLHPLFPFMSIPRVIRQTYDGGRPSGIQMVDPYHPSQKISRHLVFALRDLLAQETSMGFQFGRRLVHVRA